jgi:hypothetical protein
MKRKGNMMPPKEHNVSLTSNSKEKEIDKSAWTKKSKE